MSLARAASCSRRVSPMPVMSSVSWVSWSWWSASCCSIAVMGSSVMWSVPGVGGVSLPGVHSVGTWSGMSRGDSTKTGYGVLSAAGSTGSWPRRQGAAVGGVLPGAGQAGDDRGAAAADDQGESGGQLAVISGVATSWRVAWSWPRTFQEAWPHSLAAASRVVTSVMPARNILTELVSRTTCRPWSPHRPVSWAPPCTTATI